MAGPEQRPRANARANLQVPKLRIFLMRHSKSCSNMLREHAEVTGFDLGKVSQKVRDTPLSEIGMRMASTYGPRLRAALTERDLLTESTTIAASELLRAQQTARILFGDERELVILPFLAEEGDIPENTPTDGPTQVTAMGNTGKPRRNRREATAESLWSSLTAWIYAHLEEFPREANGDIQIIAVGHKSYLQRQVLTKLGKATVQLKNMDGFVIEADLTGPSAFRFVELVPANLPPAEVDVADDRCALLDGSPRVVTPFPLRQFTQDPTILAHEEALATLFDTVIAHLKIPATISMADLLLVFERTPDLGAKLREFTEDPVVRGLFQKLYNNQTVAEEWPPLDYPVVAPPLWSVPGYHKESIKQWNLRILKAIGDAHQPPMSQQAVFEAIRDGPKDFNEVLRGLMGGADPDAKLKEWTRLGEIDGDVVLMNINIPQRFVQTLRGSRTWAEYLDDQDRGSYYTEFEASLATPLIFATKLRRLLNDVNQQLFVFVPVGADPQSSKFSTVDDPEGVPFRETAWIQIGRPFPEEPQFIEANQTYGAAIVIQGFRLRQNPDLRRMLLSAPPSAMSEHARKLLPDWTSGPGCQKWLDMIETVDEWYTRSLNFATAWRPESGPNGSVMNDGYADYKRMITETQKTLDGRPTLQTLPGPTLYAQITAMPPQEFLRQVSGAPKEEPETRLGVNLQVIADLASQPAIDPNTVYQKFATWKEQYSRQIADTPTIKRAILDTIRPRDKRLLLGNSKERYRRTLKAQLDTAIGQLGFTGSDPTHTLLTLAESPNPDTAAIWTAFQTWRASGPINEMFRAELEKVAAPGFFSSAKTYASRIADLVRRATSTSTQLSQNLTGVLRSGGRGEELKARIKTLKAKPEYANRRVNLDRILAIDKEAAYDDTVRTKIQELAQVGGNNTFDTGSSRMRSRKQSGGGLPLAYFRDGAQMAGTYAEPTGVGLAGSAGAWVRAPLSMQGGSRRRTRRQQRVQQQGGFSPSQNEMGYNRQQGGFSPSIMGSFAANGAALLPIAAYMGFKMWKNGKRSTRKGSKSRKTGK